MQFLIALGAVGFILSFLLISWITHFYLIGFVVVPVVLSIVAPFFDVPSLKKSGKLRYHSLLLLSEKPKNGIIKIHGGTLFDYAFVIDQKMNAKQRKTFIVQQFLEGLLNLIEENENKENGVCIIRWTSYFINDKTARRIGFKVARTDNFQRLILILNFFNVCLSYSIAKDTLSWPGLKNIKTYETTLDDLAPQQEYIRNLNAKLEKAVTDNIGSNRIGPNK